MPQHGVFLVGPNQYSSWGFPVNPTPCWTLFQSRRCADGDIKPLPCTYSGHTGPCEGCGAGAPEDGGEVLLSGKLASRLLTLSLFGSRSFVTKQCSPHCTFFELLFSSYPIENCCRKSCSKFTRILEPGRLSADQLTPSIINQCINGCIHRVSLIFSVLSTVFGSIEGCRIR